VNLPSGSYNNQADAEADVSGYDDFSMPAAFNTESSTGYLIARLTFRHQAASSGTWTLNATVDLRGLTPASATGGSVGAAQTEFADNVFRVVDNADSTKEIALEASGITTGTTRTITMPDANVDLGDMLKKDGTVALTANWDAGAFEIRAQTLESDVATGTAPLTVASTTCVTNLCADTVDGVEGADILQRDGSVPITADYDVGDFDLTCKRLTADTVDAESPIACSSQTVCTNLNADFVDGIHGTALVKADGTVPLTAAWAAGAFEITANAFIGMPKLSGISVTVDLDPDDYNPVGGAAASYWRVGPLTTNRTITGLLAPTGNKLLIIVNFSASYQLTLSHQNGSSSAANRMNLGGGDIVLNTDQTATLLYSVDDSRWRCIANR